MEPYLTSSVLFFWVITYSLIFGLFSVLACLFLEGLSKYFLRLVEVLFIPGLVLGPLLLIGGHFLFSYDFIFPVAFGRTPAHLFLHLMGPSAVLFVCSGLAKTLMQNTYSLALDWKKKPCSAFTKSLGLSPERDLIPTIFLQGLFKSWSQSMPWVFGEILIIECVFNVPGIGFNIWTYAKERQLDNLWQSLAVLLCIYLFAISINRLFGVWLGKKLENYI